MNYGVYVGYKAKWNRAGVLLFGLPVITLVLLSSGCDSEISRKMITARVDGAAIQVAIAATEEVRRRGLMQRRYLGQNEGMLFVYPEQKLLKLWMLNTPLALDAGFLDRDGILVGHLSMQPDGGMHTYTSPAPAMYALEMNQGWFKRTGIKLGARLALPYRIVGE